MRRRDREVNETDKIDQIIQSCDCCRIGLVDGNKAYIVPLNFAYTRTSNRQIFYFHGAQKGRKIDLIKQNQYAGFELDTNHNVKPGETACEYSFAYQSVIGSGTISIVENEKEKIQALHMLMEHYSRKVGWTFDENVARATAIFILIIQRVHYPCKSHT